ncbi:2OG-Fe(II) oxygenase [Pseudomonas syringae pv. actinidiae]|nr:2OG-Fe(II) oxygenase [Pseudomonas syringae pv. actinidiae]
MLNDDFDINSFLAKGHCRTTISSIFADALLQDILSEAFSMDEPDEPDYVGYVEKYYQDRYISTDDRSNQGSRSQLKKMIAASVLNYQKPLLRFYAGGSDVELTNVSAYEGRTGYRMGWHQDIGDRSVSETIIYLCEKDWQEGDGGELQIAKVERDADGKIKRREIIETIVPRHGDVVILENLSPHFEHQVLPWTAHHSRFSVIVIAGMLEKY